MDWWKTHFNEDYLKQYSRFLTAEETKKETFVIEKMLHPKKANKILDLGCAQGRISIELAKRGYSVTGLDYSRYMLDVAKKCAKKEKININFVRGDMRRLSYKEEFDVVIDWFTTFGYFSDKDNEAVLRKISRSLKREGRLLIDVINKDWCLKNYNTPLFPSKTYHDYKNFVVLESHKYDKDASRDNCRRIFLDGRKRREYSWSVRLYSFKELRSMLSKAGFKIECVYGGHDLSKFTDKSRRITVVVQKKR